MLFWKKKAFSASEHTHKRWLAVSAILLFSFLLFLTSQVISQNSKGYVGSDECKTCHEDLSSGFSTSPHSKVLSETSAPGFHGCEGCHGPGKDHIALAATGKKGGIFNPSYIPPNTPPHIPQKQVEELCGLCHFKNSGKHFDEAWQKIDPKNFKRSEHKHKDVSCLSCHSLHGNKPKLLTLDESGFCVSCHKEKKQSIVAAHGQGKNAACNTCHDPHGSPRRHHLQSDVQKTCEVCHDVSKNNVLQSHGGFNAKGGNCASCHDFHGKGKKLVKTNQHMPYKDKQCGACHQDAKSASEKGPHALKKQENELCMGCHSGDYKKFITDKKVVHVPVHEKYCTSCHTPHASSEDKLLKDKAANMCFQCHPKIEEFTLATNRHPPAYEGMCLACHNVKSIADGENLIEGGIVKKCAQCHKKQMNFTHPLGKNLTIPKLEKKVNVNCASCHQVHGSDYGFIFKAPMTDQCRTCHEDH